MFPSFIKNILVALGTSILWISQVFTPWAWLLIVMVSVSWLRNGRKEIELFKKVYHVLWSVGVVVIPLFLSHDLIWKTWPQIITIMLTVSFVYVLLPDVKIWLMNRWLHQSLHEDDKGGDAP